MKNHIVKSIFNEKFISTQHKGRGVRLLEKGEKEIEKKANRRKTNHSIKKQFLSPEVIMVKNVKIALNSIELKDAIHKNSNLIQSIVHFIDAVALFKSERSLSKCTYEKYVYSNTIRFKTTKTLHLRTYWEENHRNQSLP